MTHGFMSILKEEVSVITKDGFEIGLFLFRLFIVREFRFFVLLKFLFLSATDFFNQVYTHLHVKVGVRVLRRLSWGFRLMFLISLLYKPSLFLFDNRKVLFKDFVLRGMLTEEIDLMFKSFVSE